MKFELKHATDFGWDGIKGRSYNSREDFNGASTAYFEVTGSHGRTKSMLSDRVYLVLDGEGEFEIDEEVFMVNKSDVIIVPKNTPYDYQAVNGTTLRMFLVHTPAFDPAKEVKV